MRIEINHDSVNQVVVGVCPFPFQINYFKQERVLNKLREASLINDRLTLLDLVRLEYAKIHSVDYGAELIALGYSPIEFSGFSAVKREALKLAKCEPEQLRILTDVQAMGFALGVPNEFIMADWFDEECLRIVRRDHARCELVAPLDADINLPTVALMDELLARLALSLVAHPEKENILRHWNDASHISGKDLRIHLALLMKTLVVPGGKPYAGKVSAAVQKYHKPQFTQRGLSSFIRKISGVPPLEQGSEASIRSDAQLARLKDLADHAALPLEAKFTALLQAYDAYQVDRATLERKPSPRLFRSPHPTARHASSTAEISMALEDFSLGAAAELGSSETRGACGLTT